ncbi:MAG: hypothetical protein EP297_14720 [Gammaproteobacteria bacterium]|nr:MAG: hypothetical protein EP297_14720 [Gammaproteobacteria bacterium]
MRSGLILTLPFMLFSFNAFAEESPSPSIPSGQPMYSASPSINRGDAQSEHCKQLSLQVQKLKGKPQQRWAASERYQAECVKQQ